MGIDDRWAKVTDAGFLRDTWGEASNLSSEDRVRQSQKAKPSLETKRWMLL